MNKQEALFFEALSKDRSEIADVLERRAVRGYKDSVVEKYSDQAHFIYELLQNADDACATNAMEQGISLFQIPPMRILIPREKLWVILMRLLPLQTQIRPVHLLVSLVWVLRRCFSTPQRRTFMIRASSLRLKDLLFQ